MWHRGRGHNRRVRRVAVYGHEVSGGGHTVSGRPTSRTYWWSLGGVRLRPPQWVRTLVANALKEAP